LFRDTAKYGIANRVEMACQKVDGILAVVLIQVKGEERRGACATLKDVTMQIAEEQEGGEVTRILPLH
jgi:hypothetical protein